MHGYSDPVSKSPSRVWLWHSTMAGGLAPTASCVTRQMEVWPSLHATSKIRNWRSAHHYSVSNIMNRLLSLQAVTSKDAVFKHFQNNSNSALTAGKDFQGYFHHNSIMGVKMHNESCGWSQVRYELPLSSLLQSAQTSCGTYQGAHSSGVNRHFRLVSRLIVSGATLPLPHTPSWHTQG